MFVDPGLVKSPAWLTLTGRSAHVYLIFLTKRQMAKVKGRKPGKGDRWMVTNNGRITFTYREAKDKYGISERQFKFAIDQLVEHGIIACNSLGVAPAACNRLS